MKLVKVRIRNYRSVEDSETFAVAPDVTCLVGKNESGKTNVLQALNRVNPVEPSGGLDEDIDYPARLNKERREAPEGQMIRVVEATFRYDPRELAEIENDIGPGALLSSDFTVSIGYRSGTPVIGQLVDESAVTKWLGSQLDLPSARAAAVAAESTVAGVKPEEFQQDGQHERLIRALE